MAVDIFTRQQFEANLPKDHFVSLGLVRGEYNYLVDCGNPFCAIQVSSSVTARGISEDTGENSIRAWLMGNAAGINWDRPVLQVIGAKINHWVTRTVGWRDRTFRMLQKLGHLALHVQPCPVCKELLKLGKSRKLPGAMVLSCWAKDDEGNFANHVRPVILNSDGEIIQQNNNYQPTTNRRCPTCNGPLVKVKIRRGDNEGKEAWTCPAKDERGNFLNHIFEVIQ